MRKPGVSLGSTRCREGQWSPTCSSRSSLPSSEPRSREPGASHGHGAQRGRIRRFLGHQCGVQPPDDKERRPPRPCSPHCPCASHGWAVLRTENCFRSRVSGPRATETWPPLELVTHPPQVLERGLGLELSLASAHVKAGALGRVHRSALAGWLRGLSQVMARNPAPAGRAGDGAVPAFVGDTPPTRLQTKQPATDSRAAGD